MVQRNEAVNLTPANFAEFFSAVHSNEREKRNPFPWQLRLGRQVAEGNWPEVLSLPTSAGKTSVIDIAVFALALQSKRPRFERTAPLRIFFIIDRRIVVDEVTTHSRLLAQRLYQALIDENADPILREVALRLTKFGGDMRKVISGDAPLHVAVLRGGLYRDDMWTRTPNVPTVCVSTVDQIGSRLLFRSYNTVREQWPIHAGLVGSDALLIIDEAHLSNPFVETLKSITRYQLQTAKAFGNGVHAGQSLTHPWTFVRMSATPTPSVTSFGLAEDDYQDATLCKRLRAKKEAELIEVAESKFETEIANRSVRLADQDGVDVIGVVVNRVASARSIFEKLKSITDSTSQPFDVVLLTGRVRPFDRDRILSDELLLRMRAGRERSQSAKKLFVVATQTVEVGADLDFDALVTEAATLSALRQRFGRLNRLGELENTKAVIALRKTKDGEDIIYGHELSDTWDWLMSQTASVENCKTVNLGVSSLQTLLEKSPPPIPLAERAPFLFPTHIDSWVQTNPPPSADPDPAPFLHGGGALDVADVQIVWRADIDEMILNGVSPKDEERWRDVETLWTRTVTLCPPLTRETLPVPIRAVRNWLRSATEVEVTDLEGKDAYHDEKAVPRKDKVAFRRALRWAGPEYSELIDSGDKIRPGDTLIVPATYGGADEYGWKPTSKDDVADIADLCVNQVTLNTPEQIRGRRKLRLRLHPSVLLNLATALKIGEMASDEIADAVVKCLKFRDESTTAEEVDSHVAVDDVLSIIEAHFGTEKLISTAAKALYKRDKLLEYPAIAGEKSIGFIATVKPSVKGVDELSRLSIETHGDFTTCDDTASLTEVSIGLHQHCLGVGRWAREFAVRCGLPEGLISDLEIAGQLHDFGKADPRMQLWLYGGDEMRAARNGYELIAKSKEMSANDREAMESARKKAGYPKGTRHEFLSVALANSSDLPFARVHDPELVRHLIGTHHGYARPFVPVAGDNGIAVSIKDHDEVTLTANSKHGLDRLDSGWVEQFWRLVRRYGPWGLAYLETLLRLADYARSGEEQNSGKSTAK
jgi:CRISPR-associated endonuclease/helicase Cas3